MLYRHVRVLSSNATEEVCDTPLTPCKASLSRALWRYQLPCTASSDHSTLWIFPQTSKSLLCHPLCSPVGLQGAPFVSFWWCGWRPHILAILAGRCLWWQPLWSGPANHSVPGALTSQDKWRDTYDPHPRVSSPPPTTNGTTASHSLCPLIEKNVLPVIPWIVYGNDLKQRLGEQWETVIVHHHWWLHRSMGRRSIAPPHFSFSPCLWVSKVYLKMRYYSLPLCS